MGGRDKGLLPLAGRPMAAHVLQRLSPQVGRVLISANRHRDDYAALGADVVSDALADFQGPLAGVSAALACAGAPLLLTAPCDAPLLPGDLAERLYRTLQADTAAGAAAAHDGTRRHPVCALLRRERHADLEAYLASGGRKVGEWLNRIQCVDVDFSDCPSAFRNVNDADELAALAAELNAAPRRTGS